MPTQAGHHTTIMFPVPLLPETLYIGPLRATILTNHQMIILPVA